MNHQAGSDVVKRLRRRMVLQTVAIVIGSVCAFNLIDYGTHVLMNIRNDTPYDPIDGIGMIVPMSLIVGFLYRKNLVSFNRYFSHLVEGIQEVSSGNYSFNLNPKEGGPFREVFEKFNLMVHELNGVRTLKDDFANKFSHEFRTPISSINGFSHLLLDPTISEADRLKYLKIIADESARLAHLSGNVMLLAKLESQSLVPDKTTYQLDEQIKQCVILMADSWNEKNLTVEADLSPCLYYGSEDLLKQVWINLLSNAIKYSPESGVLGMYLREVPDGFKMVISDQGPGISDEAAEVIFQKYVTGIGSPASVSATEGGLGLGLSIVKKIVHLCGGTVGVQSQPGKGSRFSVILPKNF